MGPVCRPALQYLMQARFPLILDSDLLQKQKKVPKLMLGKGQLTHEFKLWARQRLQLWRPRDLDRKIRQAPARAMALPSGLVSENARDLPIRKGERKRRFVLRLQQRRRERSVITRQWAEKSCQRSQRWYPKSEAHKKLRRSTKNRKPQERITRN